MKQAFSIVSIFSPFFFVSMSNSCAQDDSAGRWFDPLKIGIEYPINKFIINAGMGTLYFPDIESDEKIIFYGCM